MSDSKIPPRSWRVELDDFDEVGREAGWALAMDANDAHVFSGPKTIVELIVRLVNAEPEVVEALELARTRLWACLIIGVDRARVPDIETSLAAIGRALALLQCEGKDG